MPDFFGLSGFRRFQNSNAFNWKHILLCIIRVNYWKEVVLSLVALRMKRTNTQSSQGSGYGGGFPNNKGPPGPSKKPRANFEDGPSFEEELVMMDDEFISEQRIDVGEESAALQLQQKQKWFRATPESWNCKEKPLLLHWLDIDMYSGQPLAKNPDGVSKVPGSQEGPVPIIRIYGVTQEGHSVMCNVHGVTPYFYAQVMGYNEMSNEVAGSVRIALDQRVSILRITFLSYVSL
ncbi:hypothetical protein EON63_05380 [archaeon]|nr:MAG: hypothetical protein EON63_05380 [archaeon]